MLSVGSASIDITPPVGGWIQNAAMLKRAERIRDPLEANVIYLEGAADSGSGATVLIGCDIVGLEHDSDTRVREAVASAAGTTPDRVIVTHTHTHEGPRVVPTNYQLGRDEPFLDGLPAKLAQAAAEARANARPSRVGWALGHAEVGYNRRFCWDDGTHSMHGDLSRDDFAGIEGPSDPRHAVLFFADDDANVTAVLHCNGTHATCLIGSEFYSADFPGMARAQLREQFGPIPVLFFNGGMGDQAPHSNIYRGRSKNGETMAREIGAQLASETMRLIRKAELHSDVPLSHLTDTQRIPIRFADPKLVEEGRALLKQFDEDNTSVKLWDILWAHGRVMLQDKYEADPFDSIMVHAVRVGDFALSTNPCELFCQFAIDIKRRSPAAVTAVADLTGGYAGYCPTTYGILGGGYSGDPIYWTRLAPDAGYRIADTAARLLCRLW